MANILLAMVASEPLGAFRANVVNCAVSRMPHIQRYFVHIKSQLFQLATWRKVIACDAQRTGAFLAVIFRGKDCITIISIGASFASDTMIVIFPLIWNDWYSYMLNSEQTYRRMYCANNCCIYSSLDHKWLRDHCRSMVYIYPSAHALLSFRRCVHSQNHSSHTIGQHIRSGICIVPPNWRVHLFRQYSSLDQHTALSVPSHFPLDPYERCLVASCSLHR